jgi:hypothetical protein
MFLNGVEVALSGSPLSLSSVSTWLPSNYSGKVDKVEVLASAGRYGSIGGGLYAMDDVTSGSVPTTGGSVPVPPTMLLLVFGLAGLAGARKRLAKHSRTASQAKVGGER